MKRAGQNWSARCPFHQEKTPSFSVSPQKQFYHCFGCGAHGDALRFVMELEGLNFPEAVEKLASTIGLTVPRTTTPQQAQQIQQNLELHTVMGKAAEWFQQQLTGSMETQAYLAERGLTPEAVEYFRIGYAPEAWDGLSKHLGGLSVPVSQMLEAGLVIKHDSGRHYDRFRGRLMFPIRDRRGNVIAFGGRILGDGQPKYLNSPETPLFQKRRCLYGIFEAQQQRRAWRRAVVVEGYMDVIALSMGGIKGAFATLGTALSEQHIHALFALSTEVVFCFDADGAGRKAAWASAQSLLPHMTDGRQASFLFLPQGEDPDSYLKTFGAKAFRREAEGAFTLSSFVFETLKQNYPPTSLEAKAQLAKAATTLIDTIPAGVYQGLMRQALNKMTFSPKRDFPRVRPSVDARPRPALLGPAEVAAALLTAQPSLVKHVSQMDWLVRLELPKGPQLMKVIEVLQQTPEADRVAAGQALATKMGLSSYMAHLSMLGASAQETEFLGALERLAMMGKQQLADTLIAQSKTKVGLTAEQKTQLQALLQSLEQQRVGKS